MIEEKAKRVVEAVINDNQAQGLLDAVDDILAVYDTTTPDNYREAIRDQLDYLKDDLDYWLARDITDIEELEELVYVQRMFDAVQIYYDNMDEIGDVKECSIRDLKNEIIYYGGW